MPRPNSAFRLALLASTAVALSWTGLAHAQLGPAPGLPAATLGRPNGAAQLDSAGTMSAATVAPGGGTATRTLAGKLGDTVSLLDFGAKCDGTSDDTAAIIAAETSGRRITIPSGLVCNTTSISQAGIAAVFIGPGQIKTSDGSLRGPIVSQVNNAPVRTGAPNIVNGFSGDLSHVPTAIEHRVTGGALPLPAAPAGGGVSAYAFYNELAAHLIIDYFASGGDAPYGGKADGLRTGYGTSVIDLGHSGQGDVAAYVGSLYVQGPTPGVQPLANQTSFLQGPAGAIIGGAVYAGAPGVYLQGLGDINLIDNGYDVAASGSTINLSRTNNTGAYGNTWMGYRVQAGGAGQVPVDAAFSAGGTYRIGLDLVDATGTTAAIAMTNAQRYYANATQPSGTPFPNTINLGTEWWDYSPANGWEFVSGGNPVFSFGNGNGQVKMGPGTTNTGVNSTAIGGFNSVAGNYAIALGGAHFLTADSTTAMGQGVNDRGNIGATCSAAGGFAVQGDAQSCTYTLRAATTGTAAARLTADAKAVSAGGRNSVAIPSGTLYGLDITVVARDTAAPGAWAQWHVAGASLARDSAGISYTGPAALQTSAGPGASALLSVGADLTNAALSIAFTAPNSDKWHVVATVRTAEVQ